MLTYDLSAAPLQMDPPNSARHESLPERPSFYTSRTRQERSIHEVNEAKAARRAEVERRCMNLDPPIPPGVLLHMDAFLATLQIPRPLTEKAWEDLKPRLLAQRASAEERENERLKHEELFQAHAERTHTEPFGKDTRDIADREWDAVNAPIRRRLAKYADEIINEQWSGGAAITKESCPRFAADTLLYARRRFYEDLEKEEEDRTKAGPGQANDSSHGPLIRKLSLENMKWLFDNKIKSLTEKFQKELFLCNGCEGNFKFYGFEGVIQVRDRHSPVIFQPSRDPRRGSRNGAEYL
jgi:hypothetical protein